MNKQYDISEHILKLVSDNIEKFSLFAHASLWLIRDFEYSRNEDNSFKVSFIYHEEDRLLEYEDIDSFFFEYSHVNEINGYSIFHKLGWEDIHRIAFVSKSDEIFYFCLRNLDPFKSFMREETLNKLLYEE